MKAFFGKKIVWFFLIGILIGIGVWRFILVPKQEKTAAAKEKTYTVVKTDLKETLTISGEVDADEKVTLRFPFSGLISWVGVKTGDTVKKNQVIASLDQRELKKTLEKYLNSYQDSRWDFEQTKDEYRQPAQGYWGLPWDQRNALDRAFQKAQFDLNSSVLDVELKDIALKYANLWSPIDGIVTSMAAPVAGVHVTSTQSEIEIVNPATLYLSLLPDQTEVTQLTSSMSAEIVFDPYPDETVTGSIRTISFMPKAGETNTVYEAKIAFPQDPEKGLKYRLGMTADATFVINEKKDVLAIPFSFVKTEKDKKYVTKKSGSKKEKIEVTLGLESGDMVEVTGGLADGDVLYD